MRKLVIAIGVAAACATARSAPTPERVVDEQLQAYNAHDIDGFVRTFSDDVVVTSGGKVILQGKDALRERYGTIFTKYPKNAATVSERRTEGNRVSLHEIVTGRAPEHPDPWDAGWVHYEVENGLIRRMELP